MILIDTSVWIEVFRAGSSVRLEQLIDFDNAVTCFPVMQEVLQGFRQEQAYRAAKESLLSLPCLDAPLHWQRYEEATMLYRRGRHAGLTIRSATDCLIAAIAVAADVEVLHKDRNFRDLARISSLRQRTIEK